MGNSLFPPSLHSALFYMLRTLQQSKEAKFDTEVENHSHTHSAWCYVYKQSEWLLKPLCDCSLGENLNNRNVLPFRFTDSGGFCLEQPRNPRNVHTQCLTNRKNMVCELYIIFLHCGAVKGSLAFLVCWCLQLGCLVWQICGIEKEIIKRSP